MSKKWVLSKTLELGSLRADFSTSYVDGRDKLSDCVRPSWTVDECRNNRCVRIVSKGSEITLFFKACDRNEGNRIYTVLKNLFGSGCGERGIKAWIRNEACFGEG